MATYTSTHTGLEIDNAVDEVENLSAQVQIAIAASGYDIVGDFADVTKATVTLDNQVYSSKSILGYESALWRPIVALPYTPTGTDPTTGGDEDGNWVAVAVGELETIARILNTNNNNVMYDTDEVTPIVGYIYSKSQQLTYSVPADAIGKTISSVVGSTLNTTEPASYNLYKKDPSATLILKVGNDPSHSDYDFSELSEALEFATSYKISENTNGSSRIQISIPTGIHTFNSINLRNADLSGVQIWGAGTLVCTVKAVPDNITDGVWFNSNFSHLGDIGGFTLITADSVTVTDDPLISGQRWYGESLAPWGSSPTFTFFKGFSGSIGRIFTDISGGTQLLLGSAYDFSGMIVGNINSNVSNIRDTLIAYNCSVISIGYTGLVADQVFNYIINHESIVAARRVSASAFNASSTATTEGSIFIDTFRGITTVWEVAAGGEVTRFEDLFYMSSGDIRCELPKSAFTFYSRMFFDFGSGNKIVSTFDDIHSSILLTDNQFLLHSASPDQDTPGLARSMGTVQYTGDGTLSRVVLTQANVKKVHIRRLSDDKSVLTIKGEVSDVSGTNAVFVSDNDQSTRVYYEMNLVGVNYTMTWER